MRRIGVFGGSFNPIHLGHLAVAQRVVDGGWVDEVWLMVSPQNPLKVAAHDLAPEDVRLSIARQAVSDLQGVKVSDFEMQLPRPTFTWRTMQALHQHFPSDTFSLVIGADNWANFSRWAHHEELLSRYAFWVYPREGNTIDEQELPHNVHLIDAPLFPYSSTTIRERLSNGQSVQGMLPPSIMAICKAHYGAACTNHEER